MSVASLPALLPMLVFSTAQVLRQAAQARDAAREQLQRRATVAAASVGHALAGIGDQLAAIAQSEAGLRADWPALHAYALRIVRLDSRLGSISLSDAQGRQIFITLRAFGDPLPDTRAGEALRPLFARGERAVAPLTLGAVSGRAVVGVAVPIDTLDGVRFALRATVSLGVITQRLNDQRWPPDWTGTVLDQKQVIVARSRDAERFVGQSAPESVQRGLAGGFSPFEAQTKEGEAVLVGAARVPDAGWTVTVGQPLHAMHAQVREAVQLVVVAGFACALLGVAASLYLAREIGRQLRQADLDQLPAVAELGAWAGALKAAQRDAGDTARALEEARRDGLTGLAGRALFLEQAGLRLAAAGAGAVGLIYLDLDGFKLVNDRFGHEAGDRVLRDAAGVLKRCLRSDDVLGRVGGDEFAICLQADADRVQSISMAAAQRIVDEIGQIGRGVGASAGVALSLEGESLAALIDRADQAMLEAKREGRGRVCRA